MKKYLIFAFFTAASIYGHSQTQTSDSLKEVLERHEGKIYALDERVLVNEADLGKLNKIKLSGYIQAQWESYGADLEKTNGISINYEMPESEINASNPTEKKDNVMGVRIQAKF